MDIVERLRKVYYAITDESHERILQAAISEITALRNQLAECQKDAERYRWISDYAVRYGYFPHNVMRMLKDTRGTLNEFHAATDKAMSEKG